MNIARRVNHYCSIKLARHALLLSIALLLISESSIADELCSNPSNTTKVEWSEGGSHGVVIVVHGLNNNRSVMTPFISALEQRGLTLGRVTLRGHEGTAQTKYKANADAWIEDVRAAYCAARKRYPSHTISNLSYSLGTAVSLAFLDRFPDARFSSMVLLAPAVALNNSSVFVRLIDWLRVFDISLPSFAPEQYRLYDGTPFQSYHALFESVDRVRTLKQSKKIADIPTRVYLNEDDEFISKNKLKRWILRNNLQAWKLLAIEAEPLDSETYRHIIIDEASLGMRSWNKLVEESAALFGISNSTQSTAPAEG